MPRPYDFPDPRDRSVNNPHLLLERDPVVGLYNQDPGNAAQQATYLSDTVRQWFIQAALQRGWASVNFVDTTAILSANVQLV